MDNNKMPSDAQFRLQCGELSAQGLRDAKAGYMMAQSEVERLRKLEQEQDSLREDVDALQSVAAALMAERDALAKDAARYRWLRDPCSGAEHVICYSRGDYGKGLMSGSMMDAAIDAAMAEGERCPAT